MSILEAMGYGLPVVASNVGGIPSIVRNNINGFTFIPGDVEGMAAAIIEILKIVSWQTSYPRTVRKLLPKNIH